MFDWCDSLNKKTDHTKPWLEDNMVFASEIAGSIVRLYEYFKILYLTWKHIFYSIFCDIVQKNQVLINFQCKIKLKLEVKITISLWYGELSVYDTKKYLW